MIGPVDLNIGLHGGVVVSTVASGQQGPGSNSGWGLSVWNLLVFLMYALVLSGYFGFIPPSKNMHVRLIGVSEWSLGVSDCLSLCGPVMDWRPVQGVPRLSPSDSWDR